MNKISNKIKLNTKKKNKWLSMMNNKMFTLKKHQTDKMKISIRQNYNSNRIHVITKKSPIKIHYKKKQNNDFYITFKEKNIT
jgi:hypothetical protein